MYPTLGSYYLKHVTTICFFMLCQFRASQPLFISSVFILQFFFLSSFPIEKSKTRLSKVGADKFENWTKHNQRHDISISNFSLTSNSLYLFACITPFAYKCHACSLLLKPLHNSPHKKSLVSYSNLLWTCLPLTTPSLL